MWFINSISSDGIILSNKVFPEFSIFYIEPLKPLERIYIYNLVLNTLRSIVHLLILFQVVRSKNHRLILYSQDVRPNSALELRNVQQLARLYLFYPLYIVYK